MNRQLRFVMRLATVAVVVCITGWGGHAQEAFGPASNVSDLANWTADRTRVELDSGVLTVHKGEGWLRLNKVLSDFVIGMDVELQGARDKAGIFVRSWPTFDEQQGIPNNGYRVVVSGNSEEDYAAGRVVSHGRDAKELRFDRSTVAEVMSKKSAWHRYEIEGKGDTLKVTLDGRLVSEAGGVWNPQGFLAVRVDEGTVRLRNVVLREAGPPAPRARDGVFQVSGDIVLPRLLRRTDPQYTADAMSRKIQGRVVLSVVVLPDGSVGDVEVVRSLDPEFGLDDEVVRAARAWRFTPGTRQGRPVPVQVTLEMTFSVR